VPTSRIEAFSDGVIAIAITLLVLEVKIPSRGGASLSHALLDQWPAYLSYAVSFMTIGIMWVNHHQMFTHIGRADRVVQFLKLGLLMGIAFVPFPTAVVAEFVERSSDQRPAAVLYGATFTLTAVFFNTLWQYVVRSPGVLEPDADARVIRGITRSYRPGIPLYASATVIAFASPIASVALFGAIAIFYMLSPARFG
jgi:TMEM175 potassium channel family protein